MYIVLKGGVSISDQAFGTLLFSLSFQMSHSLCARVKNVAFGAGNGAVLGVL